MLNKITLTTTFGLYNETIPQIPKVFRLENDTRMQKSGYLAPKQHHLYFTDGILLMNKGWNNLF